MRYQLYLHQMGSDTETLFYDSMSEYPETMLTEATLSLELSKAGTLEFDIMPSHPCYDDFHKLSTFVRVVYNEEEEIFRGRVLEIEDTIYKERTVKCEGDLAYLIDSLQAPDTTATVDPNRNPDIEVDNSEQKSELPQDIQSQLPDEEMTIYQANLPQVGSASETVYAHFCRYILVHNAQVDAEKYFYPGVCTVDERNTTEKFTSTNYRDTKQAFDSDLIKYYGGYLQTRPGDANSEYITYIDYLKEPLNTVNQPIRVGINMLDLTRKSSGNDIFTVFVPIGSNNLTIASVNDGYIGIEIPEAIEKYGYILKTESYSGIKDAATLKRLGEAYIAANYKDEPLKITTKAIDMNILDENVDRLQVGSKVRVISRPHNLNVVLACIKIDYDLLNPENTTYEIGDPSETLSQKTNSDMDSVEEEAAVGKYSGGYASGCLVTMEDVLNRHGQNISDIADQLYSIQADELRIRVRLLSVEADLIQIHTRALSITASEVSVTADVIYLGGVAIEPDSEFDCHIHGSLWADEAYFDGVRIPDDAIYGFQNGNNVSYMSSTTVFAQDFELYTANGNSSLGDCIMSFGIPTYNGNSVTLPYTTASGSSGSVTFSKTASINGVWSSGYYQITATEDPNTVILQTQLFGLNKVANSETISGTNITGQAEVMYYAPNSGSVYNWAGTGYTGSITLDASGVYSNGTTAGWNLAYGKFHILTTSSGQSTTFSVQAPASTYNTQDTYNFLVSKGSTPSSSGYASVSYRNGDTGNYIMAGRVPIGDWYDAGYSAGRTDGGQSAWVYYASTAGSNHQGTLDSNKYVCLSYIDANGQTQINYANTWLTPTSGSTSHSVKAEKVGTYSTKADMDAAAAADYGSAVTVAALGTNGGSSWMLIRATCNNGHKKYYSVH